MSKLLIVDDEIDVREFAKNFFKKRNIEVFTAGGGKTAFEIIEKENPDLVLLDVRMEEMTGVEVLEKIRSTGNQIKENFLKLSKITLNVWNIISIFTYNF